MQLCLHAHSGVVQTWVCVLFQEAMGWCRHHMFKSTSLHRTLPVSAMPQHPRVLQLHREVMGMLVSRYNDNFKHQVLQPVTNRRACWLTTVDSCCVHFHIQYDQVTTNMASTYGYNEFVEVDDNFGNTYNNTYNNYTYEDDNDNSKKKGMYFIMLGRFSSTIMPTIIIHACPLPLSYGALRDSRVNNKTARILM